MVRIIVGWILMFIGAIPYFLLVALLMSSIASEAHIEIHAGSLITGFIVFCAGFAIKEWGHKSRQPKEPI